MPQQSDNKRFAKVFEILQANKKRDFVQRILDPQNADAIVNQDGSFSTHLMATAEADGVHYVYPTVIKNELGNLQRYEGAEAFRTAIRQGDAIGFKTAEEADWFERNWKVVWGHEPRKD
jgi:hypothetical protein